MIEILLLGQQHGAARLRKGCRENHGTAIRFEVASPGSEYKDLNELEFQARLFRN